MKPLPLTFDPDQRIRRTSAIGTVVFHLVVFLLMSLVVVWHPTPQPLIELDWGGSGGGKGESQALSRTVPTNEEHDAASAASAEKKNVDVPAVRNPSSEAIPSAKKVTKKAGTGTKKSGAASGEAVVSRKRAGGKGSGGGVGGGIGVSTGYSIDWSGSGSRKLLSGRMPSYPEGTNKEMPVLLQFTVLPDGSVSSVIPLRRSDELLEREAIAALRTWRFDPLPPQYEQGPQTGRITFNFTLEH